MSASGSERPSDGGRPAGGDAPAGIPRREALKRMGTGAMGMGAAYAVPPPVLESFLRLIRTQEYAWEFFTPPELETMRVLADTIIPADERSGSATDAGTVEYVDFILSISDEDAQAEWRDGLAWLDAECARLHAELGEGVAEPGDGDAGPTRFVDCAPGLRARVLNQVAWPEGAAPGLELHAEWFSRVRDLVGSGFFTSRMGVEDVGYIGGYMRPSWEGAPPEALAELGLSYDEWDARYGDAT